jgi:four helix bundle protein
MRGFRDLDIWKEAHALRLEIYKISSKFPPEEKYNLTSQIRRSSSSVADQIAEAHGRYYFADKSRVLYQGRGEAEEVRSQLSLALGLKYIKLTKFNELDGRYENLEMRMSKYIKSLKYNRDKYKKRPN